MKGRVLVIDQGTTSTRAIVFDADAAPIAMAQQEFRQIFPRPGWVEHDPEDIWTSVLETGARGAAQGRTSRASDLAGARHRQSARNDAGLESARRASRSTTPSSGRTVAPRRCAPSSKSAGHRAHWSPNAPDCCSIPIFPRPRSRWLLDNVDGARARPSEASSRSARSTAFCIWRLTGGRTHATDATNASRTLLLNIHSGEWDDELLKLFRRARAPCCRKFAIAQRISG